jgi:hypothetical protein
VNTTAPATDDALRKLNATLAARAALAGFALLAQPDGSFAISRWGLVRDLPDAAAVLAFLALVGAPA